MADGTGKNILTNIIITVASSAITAVLAIVWNLISGGGLIHSLGGVTASEFEKFKAKTTDHKSEESLPSGIVVAFNSHSSTTDQKSHCPDKWSPFEEARGRVIVGAGVSARHNFSRWEQYQLDGKPSISINLTNREPFAIGGEESHILRVTEMPYHRHSISTKYRKDESLQHDALGGSTAVFGVDEIFDPNAPSANGYGVLPSTISGAGSNQPHNIMPPFIALYFCVKD